MDHKNALKLRKLFFTFVLMVVVLLSILVPVVLGIELPPTGSVAFIQTSGPNTALLIGDWYTNAAEGNQPHRFTILVPCTLGPTQDFTVELFDPEMYIGPTVTAIDEIRDAPNNRTNDNNDADVVTFTLRAPDNSMLANTAYPPSDVTNEQWVTFATFDVGTSGCGTYTLFARTGDDDDNAWRIRVTPDDPDGTPGTGDEIALGTFETSFQHGAPACQVFHFFVPMTDSIRLHNFDLDGPPGFDNTATVEYFPPGGGSIPGTSSGPTEWNNGDASTRGGDVINNPPAGWWQTEICVTGTPPGNQYIFEPEGSPYFFAQPPSPAMAVSKDDGRTLVGVNDVLTYTIVFSNPAPPATGAAINVVLTDQLPANTTYVPNSCAIDAPYTGTCSESGGIVTFAINEIVTAGSSGSVRVSVRVNPGATGTISNSVTLEYEDGFGNAYPPETDTDVDTVAGFNLQLTKTDGGVIALPGGVITYTLDYYNTGPANITGVVITETVPADTTFNAAASLPTAWSCPDGSLPGTICTTIIGAVAGGTGGSVTFAVNVDDPLPPGTTEIVNTATIADDGTNGPESSTDDNTATENTPTTLVIVDPIITKSADTDTARPGDPVNFSIMIFNPAPPSTANATNVVLTDPLPLEFDLITYSVSSNPPGLVNNPSDTQDIVSTIGHPSGVTETVASTVTVDIPVLGLNEALTLSIIATLNDLASPPPLRITNVATLDYDEGGPKTSSDSVDVPLSSGDGDGDRDDDDDDDDDATPTPAVPQPPSGAEPTPTLPVLFLPETGTIGRPGLEANPIRSGLLLMSILGAGVTVLFLWQRYRKR